MNWNYVSLFKICLGEVYTTGKKWYGPIEKWYITHNFWKEIPGDFFTKIMATVPLFNGRVPFFACRVKRPFNLLLHLLLFSQIQQLTDQFCDDTDVLLGEKTKELLRK